MKKLCSLRPTRAFAMTRASIRSVQSRKRMRKSSCSTRTSKSTQLTRLRSLSSLPGTTPTLRLGQATSKRQRRFAISRRRTMKRRIRTTLSPSRCCHVQSKRSRISHMTGARRPCCSSRPRVSSLRKRRKRLMPSLHKILTWILRSPLRKRQGTNSSPTASSRCWRSYWKSLKPNAHNWNEWRGTIRAPSTFCCMTRNCR
mmetsp:Transcript_44779/g.142665  ORF Transcript_44779/g.142665 Transcript_44779/m.142665 type:complete len:200 (-) Transcript_44779:1393-1992(-)